MRSRSRGGSFGSSGDEDEAAAWARWEAARTQKQAEETAVSQRARAGSDDSTARAGMRVGPGLYMRGTYVLEDEIGRGGFAMVHRARNVDSGDAVAAKVCPFKKTRPEAVQREVEMMLMLRHPAVVRLWDVVVENSHNRRVPSAPPPPSPGPLAPQPLR